MKKGALKALVAKWTGEDPRVLASAANEKGNTFEKEGMLEEAIAEYQRACELDPTFSQPFFNLGLIFKYAGEWQRSLEMNRRAAELDPENQGSWWNLAVAATAIERWDVAREAWAAAIGNLIPAGEGPIDFPCGFNPIRLNPEGRPEVVWAHRLDPARAMLQNIPLPESGFRWHDIVLNDGAPAGYRRREGRDVPVFNCLQLLEPSPFSTFLAEVDLEEAVDPEEVDRLIEMAEDRGMAAENWSTSLRTLCAACSEGRPHEHHDHEPDAQAGSQRLGIAARSVKDAEALLADWCSETSGITLISIEKVLAADAM